MSSSTHWFLLFLLLLILLFALLWRMIRKRTVRPAPTPRVELSPTTPTMQAPIAQGAEEARSNRWKALVKESETTIEKYLVPDINVNLGEFIRCATFRAFLVVFLGVDPDTLAYTNVQLVTGAIVEYYKDREGTSALALEIQGIFDKWLLPERYPSSLDNIIPAYEALWRIVATIVVKCEEDETKVSRWVMLDFRDNPRDRQYTASFGHGKSASAITEAAFGRLIPIARPLYATAQNWPLDCIQYATTGGEPPTVQEALKFAGLLAAMVIGQVGVHYAISGDGGPDSQLSPWDQRKIFGVRRDAASQLNGAEGFPHASTSRQAQNGY